jgi:hypothetical protein
MGKDHLPSLREIIFHIGKSAWRGISKPEMLGVLEPPLRDFLKSRIPLTPLVMKRSTIGGTLEQKIHSTGGLVRISSIVCAMPKTLMNCNEKD